MAASRSGPRGFFASEQRFALLMVSPGLVVLLLTTSFPLGYLIWSSFQNINLAMPFLDGFIGMENYVAMWSDTRYWHALQLTAIYTSTTVVL